MNPSTSLRQSKGLGIDLVWLAVILAGFGFYVSLVPLAPNDFWWHLKIGQLIYQDSAIPTTNIFAWSLPADTPFTYGAWLGETLFYLLYHIGQLPLVIFTRTVLALLAFGLVGYESKRRSGSWRIAALVVTPACLMTINNLVVRPQNWSWLPFMVFFILLGKYADGQLNRRWLLTLPLIMALWVNLHGAFILGIILVGIFFLGETLRTWRKLPGALLPRAVGWLGGVGLLTGLAILVNPRFVRILGYVIDLMTDRPSQGLIEEWQSPSPVGIANVTFFVTILILLIVLVYSRYRPTPSEILLVIAFLWLAWSGQRYVVWFSMVSMPILARAISELPVRKPSFEVQRNWLNVALVVMVCIPVLAVQPWFVERLPLPRLYLEMIWRDIPDGPLVDVETPVTSVQYLKEHPGGILFNEMGYGSYLIWALPQQGVFIDPRVELYPYEQWQDYIRISRGVRYNELLEKYGADRVLLNSELQKELARQLPADPGWGLEHQDGHAQLWTRVEDGWQR
jgi:hypothetical protein